tara:strand:+ start:47 stop:724 length:678 start_codon:yes stop_codon:yes gene_type:complete
MKTKKINLPNYGVLDVTLDKVHCDHLHHLVEKYEPDNAKQQWMLIDDDNRFQKEVVSPSVKEYIHEYGIPEKLLSTHIHDLTFQKFWANYTGVGEYQALHNHNAVFSFVVWLKLPSCAIEEQAVPDTMHPEAGNFILQYTDITGRCRKQSWTLEQQYNEGHMLLFPSCLYHAVYPHFLTEEKRLSVAGDIAINSMGLKGISDQGMPLGPCNSQEFLRKDSGKAHI